MGHGVADAFALAVLQVLGGFYDFVALLQGELELVFNSGYGAALEDVIGNHAAACQVF